MSRKDPDIPFMYDFKYIQNFLKDSSVPMEATLLISKIVTQPFQQHDTTIIPSAMADMVSCQGTDKETPSPTQSQYHNNSNNRYRNKLLCICIICNGSHMETNCIY